MGQIYLSLRRGQRGLERLDELGRFGAVEQQAEPGAVVQIEHDVRQPSYLAEIPST